MDDTANIWKQIDLSCQYEKGLVIFCANALERCKLKVIYLLYVQLHILYHFCVINWSIISQKVLVSVCPKIEAIDISYCTGFGDREAAAVAKASGLKELKIDKCLQVTDVGLAKVAVGCSGLERLGIKWCREISDIGIDLLAKKCLELRELDISYLKVYC